MKRILLTGGAGFVGSNLACSLARAFPGSEVTAFDNLKRRGSELALARLKEAGVHFVHGDIRVRSDLQQFTSLDLVIDCAAEPSVLAGVGGAPDYVVDTNLGGTLNILELCRVTGAKLLFLSTSRVYPYAPLNSLPMVETETRFELQSAGSYPVGASPRGIAEDFPLEGARTLYGATKLCSELLLREYEELYGIPTIINRCGVLAGPWQMGKVDQGFIVLWLSRHFYGGSLSYLGFNGSGKQVRDVLHVADLFDLLMIQLADFDRFRGATWNVGGGRECSCSLRELTDECRRVTGRTIEVAGSTENRPGDVALYLTDSSRIQAAAGWRPKRSLNQLLGETFEWLSAHREELRGILS